MTQLPEWVRPVAAEVTDAQAQAAQLRERGAGPDAEYAEGVAAAIAWVTGQAGGPATGRDEQPLTRGMAVAEMWAAAALSDGGGTTERELQAAARDQRVPYRAPRWDAVSLEAGYGAYRALSWLLRSPDGYLGGRVSPMDLATAG